MMSGPKSTNRLTHRSTHPPCACLAVGLLAFLLVIAGIAFSCSSFYQTALAPVVNVILGKAVGRTNILLLGSDTDGKGNDPTNGVPLAQTVMIITVDSQTSSVGILSIPRDMQVVEDGYTEPKLDEVFSHGYVGSTLQDKITNGAREMESVIFSNFGISIDRYAWVGLDGFVKVIDTAGGVDIDVIHPVVDDTYPDDVGNPNGSIYDYKRLSIAPGPQHLSGTEALDYVRTRHSDLVGDFGRTVRQQQVISQLKNKLANPDTIGKAPQLWQDLNGAVQTDIPLNDVINLANLARTIDGNSVERLTLGPPDYAVPNTDGVRSGNYLPVCSAVVPAIEKMFKIPWPRCFPQGANRPGHVARTTQSTMTSALTVFHTARVSESKQALAEHSTVNNSLMNTSGNSLDAGVHSLLDILFAVTFESFDALQI